MTKEVSDECTANIIEMWKNCIEKALCIARYHMETKTLIDFDLKPESEYDCKECTSPFCFKTLEWDDSQEFIASEKSRILTPKDLEGVENDCLINNEYEAIEKESLIAYG